MSHVRGKDQNNAGKFAFTCYDWQGNIFREQGGFNTAQEADRAAANAEREMTFAAMTPQVNDDFELTDDEILAILGA